ncbi:MAG: UDP-2,3-diacylglucosamine diphosphatase [Gammaproteobacteria bacterium]|nr:UDP-2,3-diacylglucosamine diphosphatase [Gammaproteobacteria bacterium]
MTVLFISDLHLAVQRPRMLLQFYEFIDIQAPQADAIYILGDLFEYWIGDDAAEATGNEPIVLALRNLATHNPHIYFIRGNRDFLVGDGFSATTGVAILEEPTVIELFGQRTLLMHGDSLCTDDVIHQQFRAMVDSPKWQKSFLEKPVDQRLKLAKEARLLSEQNKQLTPMDIMDVNDEEVARQMERYDVRLLIHGHTHRPGIHAVDHRDGIRYRIVLGDWYDQCSVLSVTESGCSLTPGNEQLVFDSFTAPTRTRA